MKVLVQVWCEIDPTLNVRIDRQSGTALADTGDELARVSHLGRAGMTAAVDLGATEIVAFGTDREALIHALAAGATHAVELEGSDVTKWIAEQKPDLAIIDRQPIRLPWAHLAGIEDLRVESGRLHAMRRLGRGNKESCIATLPAIVRLQTESPRYQYVSQTKIARAAGKSIEHVVIGGEAEPVGPLQATRPRTKLGAAPAAPASAMNRLNALMGLGKSAKPVAAPANKTPDDMAEEFVRYISHHNLLD